MPKGVPNSGKRNMSSKRGPKRKLANTRQTVVKRAPVKRALAKNARRMKAPVTRTSAKSVVTEKFEHLQKELTLLRNDKDFVVREMKKIQIAAFMDQWCRFYKSSTADEREALKVFMDIYTRTINVLCITEEDLLREVEQSTEVATQEEAKHNGSPQLTQDDLNVL